MPTRTCSSSKASATAKAIRLRAVGLRMPTPNVRQKQAQSSAALTSFSAVRQEPDRASDGREGAHVGIEQIRTLFGYAQTLARSDSNKLGKRFSRSLGFSMLPRDQVVRRARICNPLADRDLVDSGGRPRFLPTQRQYRSIGLQAGKEALAPS